MTTRDEMIKRLHDDDLFKASLDKAKDDDERQAIAAFVEGFVGVFADAMEGILAKVESGELVIDNDLSGSQE